MSKTRERKGKGGRVKGDKRLVWEEVGRWRREMGRVVAANRGRRRKEGIGERKGRGGQDGGSRGGIIGGG